MPVKGAVSHLFHNLIFAISARQPGKKSIRWKGMQSSHNNTINK